MKNLRKLSLLLALVMILSSFSVVAFADTAADDADISINLSKYSNAKHASNTAYISSCNPKYVYDEVPDGTVISFKDSSFWTNRSAGNEPRIHLNGIDAAANTALGGLDWKNYKYLRMSFNIYLGDSNDGFAFRTRRRDANDAEVASDMYIAIGGSDVTAPASGATVLSNNTLTAGKWHNVVMELGSTETTVKFFIDGTQVNVGNFTSGTYGFVGNTNRCVLTLMGAMTNSKGSQPLDVRLHNFKMTATNTAYTVPATAAALNQVVYEMTSSSTFIDKTTKNESNQVMTRTTDATAPHIADKTAVRHTVESFAAASSAGSESGYSTLTSAGGFLGGSDVYKNYDNLRIMFNIYIADASNGVYFRTRRTSDGSTWNTDNYVFNIGGAEFNGASLGSGTHYTYTYKGLETGKWHNVVMEIGANSSNTDVKYYVDGELVETAKSDAAQNGMSDAAYGFGGGNTNWAFFAMSADTESALDLYLSDLKMIVCNTTHNPANVPAPSVAAAENAVVGVGNEAIYVESALSASELTVTDGVLNISDTENLVAAYNDASKRIKYYDIVKGGLNVDNIAINILSDGKINAKAKVYNFTGEAVSPYVLIAMYKDVDGIPTLVDAKPFDVDDADASYIDFSFTEDGKIGTLNGYKAGSVTVDENTTEEIDYDYIKLFFWEDSDTTLKPIVDAARKDK